MDKSDIFLATVITAIALTSLLYLISRFGLRRFKFSKDDTKAAGLNRKEGRRFLARNRKKGRKRMRF